jgi:ribonucleotide monophosphatase NagD (HAD superfamily)
MSIRFVPGFISTSTAPCTGERLLPGAKGVVAALREAGRRVCFLSNKPIASREDYAAKLTRLGVPTEVDEVINSSYVLARHLAREAPGARCFVIGEPPLVAELERAGLAPVDGPRVDSSWSPSTAPGYRSSVALRPSSERRPADGTNLTAPVPPRTAIPDAADDRRGGGDRVPGGYRREAVADHLRVALERPASRRATAPWSDRLETDIAMGKAAGPATILVLTGITPPGDPAIARWRPDHVLASLEEILA